MQGNYLSKNLRILSYVFDWLYFTVSYFFFPYRPPLSLSTVFYSISSDRDEVLSINPSADVCLWRLYRKSWLTYTDGTGRPGELCYDFSISNDLTQMLNFPTRIHDRGSRNPALLDLFPLTLLFVLQWLSLHWKILIMLTQFPLDFQKLKTGCHVSSHSL